MRKDKRSQAKPTRQQLHAEARAILDEMKRTELKVNFDALYRLEAIMIELGLA